MVSGFDDWLSRGHERLDDDPDPVHPLDEHDDECLCTHGLTVGEFCVSCALDAELQLAAHFAQALRRVEGR